MLNVEPGGRVGIENLIENDNKLYNDYFSLKERPFFIPKENSEIDGIYFHILKRIENKVKLRIEIDEKKINKDVFFLDNDNRNDSPHLTELNEKNSKLVKYEIIPNKDINSNNGNNPEIYTIHEEIDYQKSFKFGKKGKFEVILYILD